MSWQFSSPLAAPAPAFVVDLSPRVGQAPPQSYEDAQREVESLRLQRNMLGFTVLLMGLGAVFTLALMRRTL